MFILEPLSNIKLIIICPLMSNLAVEQELGIKLLNQLRSFYLFANGAELIKHHLNLEYPLTSYLIDINSLDEGALISIFKSIKENYDFFGGQIEYGDYILPIAYTDCPWVIYIAHTGENLGKIYISEEKDEERNLIPVRLITNSFFQSRLFSDWR